MGKKVAIVQSSYIPWKGYFDLINQVDEFILFDDAQYTRRDWRNRNRIKTPHGLPWLTIPVYAKGKYLQKIKETIISDPGWNQKHWMTISQHYSRSPNFQRYSDFFEEQYLTSTEEQLSRINERFIKAICHVLGINTKLSWSMNYEVREGKNERLLHLCQQAGATEYLSGPNAKAYLDEPAFNKAGIAVHYMDYSGYREYRQLSPPFEYGVSIIDLILTEGPDARKYMKSF